MGARATYRAMAGGVLAIVLCGAWACVLADPPAALPIPPLQPVVILRLDVQPPITSFLDTIPSEFQVPVTADPQEKTLDWRYFIDGILVLTQKVDITLDGGPTLLHVPSRSPVTEECHTLEIVVSYTGSTQSGDSVTWFYSPTRSFATCPIFDAGPGDAVANGGADAAGSGD